MCLHLDCETFIASENSRAKTTGDRTKTNSQIRSIFFNSSLAINENPKCLLRKVKPLVSFDVLFATV